MTTYKWLQNRTSALSINSFLYLSTPSFVHQLFPLSINSLYPLTLSFIDQRPPFLYLFLFFTFSLTFIFILCFILYSLSFSLSSSINSFLYPSNPSSATFVCVGGGGEAAIFITKRGLKHHKSPRQPGQSISDAVHTTLIYYSASPGRGEAGRGRFTCGPVDFTWTHTRAYNDFFLSLLVISLFVSFSYRYPQWPVPRLSYYLCAYVCMYWMRIFLSLLSLHPCMSLRSVFVNLSLYSWAHIFKHNVSVGKS